MGKIKVSIKVLTYTLLSLMFLNILCRVFICDSFIVSGPSMEPTFHDGQRVWAFKIGIGARIYTRYDFSDPELHSFRMPGIRKLRKGDIAIFNHPYGVNHEDISFKINYVLIKRCAGVPGDTVQLNLSEKCFVPGRGDFIILDSCTFRQYSHQIEFETEKKLTMDDNHAYYLDEFPITEYQFVSDWFFFIGDNIALSRDSRQFGLVPESYIIGRIMK